MDIKQEKIQSYVNETMRISVVVLVMFAVATSVIWMAIDYAETSFSRDVDNWNIRMSVTADIRKDNIDRWVESEQKEVRSIAKNQSLRLYMSEIHYADSAQEIEEKQENHEVFLRNYILSSALKNGYMQQNSLLISANVDADAMSGLYLLDKNMNVMVGTGDENVLTEDIKTFVKASGKQDAIYDIQFLANRTPVMAFVSPVFGIQEQNNGEGHIGYVIGVKNVEGLLYPTLYAPSVNEKTVETYLIRAGAENKEYFQYLSPIEDKRIIVGLGNNFPVKSEVADVNSTALREPQSVMKMGRDFSGEQVLYVTRKVDQLPWVLIHKVDRHEALAESDQRRFGVVSISVLFIFVILLLIIALWRHTSSLKYQKLAQQFRSQERLLRLVADNVPDSMYIIDDKHMLRFVNKSAAHDHRKELDDLLGESVLSLMKPHQVEEFQSVAENVVQRQEQETHIRTVDSRRKGDISRTLSTTYVPLERIPRVLKGETSSGVLVVDQDVTELMEEKEKKENNLKELVNVIVKLVDSRDSYTARHSERVANLAQAIAVEMELSAVDVETAFIAGEIMNIGKVMLPKTILNKKDKLSPKERETVQEAILKSAALVETINFEGAVVETLRQTHERYDGGGVLGLKGEDIIITARILHVANACVAMLSNRSYRKKIAYDDIVAIFMSDNEERYDRSVVVSMINHFEKDKNLINILQG